MASFAEIYQIAESILARWIGEPRDFWKGIYSLLLWYEHQVPHIIDSNDLRKPLWKQKAKQVERALAEAFGCQPSRVGRQVDQLLRHPLLRSQQRQNPLGTGFSASLIYYLRLTSNPMFEFIPEAVVGKQIFLKVSRPPRQRVDIAVKRSGREFAIISSKWSIRHDRLKDWLDECDFYKTQAALPYYFVVTNEYGPARIKKVLDNACKNGLFHVNRDLVLEIHGGNGRLEGLEDLTGLFAHFQ
ncbi:MAG: hypothetical protein ACE5H0_13990 [Bacteroidota bacterium]